MLSYLGVWSLGLFSPTFFSTSSKKKVSQGATVWGRNAQGALGFSLGAHRIPLRAPCNSTELRNNIAWRENFVIFFRIPI